MSEWEETKRGAVGGGGGSGGVAAGNEVEEKGRRGGDIDDLPGDEGAEETDAFGEGGMGTQEMRALWDPIAFGGGDSG